MFSGDQLLITFPTQYINFPTVDTTYSITMLKWNPDLSLWQTLSGSSCIYKISVNLFKVTLPDLKSGNYKLTIPSITNPSHGGTGNFKLETRQNAAYQKDTNLVDFNYAFGKVGIASAPTDFTLVSVTYSKSSVNDINTINFSFTTTFLIPQAGKFSLDLTNSILTLLNDQYTATTTLQGNITQDGLLFYIDGFDQDQPIGTYQIIIEGIQNPNYSGIPGQYTLRTWTNYTNTILNQKKYANLPTINSGVLTDVTLLSHSTLGQTEVISINDLTTYQITFSLKNIVLSTGLIKINWLSSGITSSCIVTQGLYDQSEANQVICSYTSTGFSIINFRAVQPKTKIIIQFQATNPSSGSMLNYQINTYQDQSSTKLIDTFSQSTGLTLYNYPQFNVFVITFPTATNQQAGQTAGWLVNWRHSTAPTSGDKLKLLFPSSFTFSGITCSASNDASVADTGSCLQSSSIITYTFGSASFSTTNLNTLNINGIKNPTTPGSYPICIDLISGGSIISRKTIYLNVNPYTLTSISSFRLSSDQSTYTLIYFQFPALQDIPSSQWRYDYSITTSEIWVEFQTSDSNNPTSNLQFPLDLGSGLSDGASFPCYGYQKLQPLDGNDEIQCTLVKSSGVPNPVRVRVHHFRSVLLGQIFQLHLPNIQNPKCETYTVTVDDLCRSTASVTIKILYTKNRKQYIMYQNDASDSSLILSAVLPNIVVKNPLNDNLTGGLPSQASPKFVPTQINSDSTIQIRYQPGSTKPLTTSDVKQGIIIIFPQLPTTTPQAYIVNKNIACSQGLLNSLNCFAYQEVGWVVIIPTTLLSIPVTNAIDTTFYLKNFVNPYYAADPNGYIQIYTIKGDQQWERTIYQDLASFTPGGATSAQVTARRYEANMINVEYNWLFSFEDDIPAGGKILLTYAVNYYDLGGTGRFIDFQINQGITSTSGTFSSTTDASVNTNIYTITNFEPYTKGTIISITMTGIKNPSTAGLTNNFGVASQSLENYYIDQKTDITAMTIISQVATGEITFNYFKMSPDNGSPTGSVFPATYEVSFYPTRNIPQYGTITVTFPSDFDTTSFLDLYTDNSYIRCYISGSITTMKDCTISGLIVTITLDTELRIESGMEPIIIKILNVRNFNEDKNSGVVAVQTIYDAVVLDDSGTTETNRKATTGLMANFLTSTQYSFIYYPTTEGVQATYELTLIPTLQINTTATIIVEFPLMFPYGLGGSIGCNIPVLSKASNDPIQCSVSAWQVSLSNVKAFTPDTTGFTIILTGVRNPNQQIVTTPLTYSQGIRVYIMSNSSHASEYVDNMGTLTFDSAAPILFMPQLIIGSSNTRDYSDYTLQLLPEISGNPTSFKLDFQTCYQIAELWSTDQLTLDGTSYSVTTSANSLTFDITYAMDPTKTTAIIINQLPNPLDEGICPGYPDVSLYDNTTSQIIMQTYWNLMQPSTPNFTHAGKLIIIDDDDPNHYIEAGTYSNNITLSLYPVEQATQDMVITPTFDEDFQNILTITTMTINSGSSTGVFRIGVDSSISVLKVVIKFTHSISGYIPLRPIYLWIDRYYNISITTTDVFSVPAGGRSSVQQVYMTNGPYKSITFSFYLLNNLPLYSAVYPSTLTLSSGEQTGKFWISCGADTQGATGSLMTIISGDDKSTFVISNRLRNFTVVNPDLNIPFIVSNAIKGSTATTVSVQVITNEACTIYFAVTPTFIREITFQQIKNKTLPYDYFNYPFIFGEYVDDSSTYTYNFQIDSLTSATQYLLTIYVEDFSGNLADSPISQVFNTTGYSDPLSSSLDLSSTPQIVADTNTSLTITGIGATGKVYAIALKNPSYIYTNHFEANSSVLRSRLLDEENNFRILTDEITLDEISSDPYVPDNSDYTCTQLNLNYLSQICTSSSLRDLNFTRIDYYATQLIITPTGQQIARGENYQGIIVEHSTSSSDGTIKFENLTANYDYYIYIAQESNGQYSETPLFIKGTTRTPFLLYSYLLKTLIFMIILQ